MDDTASNKRNAPDASTGSTERMQWLEEQVAYLSREKAMAVHSLEIAANLGNFQTSLNKLEDPDIILSQTVEKMRTVMLFESAAIYLVDVTDSDLVLAYCDPPQARPDIERELAALIEDKTLAWAMGRNKPVIVSATDKSRNIMLHTLSTTSRTRGMFIGVLGQGKSDILDISYALAPILFLSSANLLESYELYRRIKDINAALSDNLTKLEDSQRALRQHRDQLEEQVAARTTELSESNVRLTQEVSVRRRAEEALVRERDFSAAVLDTAAALVLVLDPAGRIVRFNKACEEATEYMAAEVREKFVWDLFIPPSERQAIIDYFHRLTSGNFPHCHENEWMTKSGSRRFIAWSNSCLLDHDGDIEYVIATGIDITEKKSAEAALRDSEARFRAVFMRAGIGISLHDVDNIYLDCNPEFLDMLGYQANELLGKSTAEFTHSDDLPASREADTSMLAAERETCSQEKRFRRKDGAILFGRTTTTLVRDSNNQPQYFLSMVEDITEAKQMEETLREVETTYRTLFENAVEGVFMARPDGLITTANPAMARILGYASPPKLLAATSETQNHYADQQSRKLFLDTLAAQGAVANYEIQFVRKDDRTIWLSISARACPDKHGAVARIEGLAEDITDRKISEFHLQRKATFDGLTNIPNRYLFHDRFEQMLSQAKRLGHTVSLLYIDLDEFKRVNDTHGHHVGDLLLAEAATRLKTRVRRSDTLARLGGDEFTILLYDIPNKQDVENVAAQIVISIAKPYYPENIKCTIAASVGVSIFPYDGDDPNELLRKADAAMYKAKEAGGNSYVFYDGGCGFKTQ